MRTLTSTDAVNRKLVVNSNGVSVSLASATIGKGEPKTLIISGVHGDERSGQLLIVNLLKDLPDFIGTLTVLPVANPLAYVLGQRQEPLSGQDLNRSFTGKNDGRPVFEIAAAVMDLVQHTRYVIDLHSYTTAGLIQAGIAVGDQSAKMAEVLDPDVVRVAHITPEYKIEGSLSGRLHTGDMSYLLVEVPPNRRISVTQVKKVILGLQQHLVRCHEYPTLKAHRLRDKPFVRIKLMKAVRAGVFERDPSLRLGASVRANDVLGSLIALPDNKAFSIASPYSGIICEMEDALQDAVNAGETLMGIGEPVPDIEKAEFFGGM